MGQIIGISVVVVLVAWALHDIIQKKHAILRNFPIVGHFRYWLEAIGPELRQYIVTSNNEERPFSRDQRRWVYASSKNENNYFGFGTDEDLESSPHYLILKQAGFPVHDPLKGEPTYDDDFNIPCAKILGQHRNRKHAFRPKSIVNLSGMSFGSLSGPAIEALNGGAKLANFLHNTGEGGITPYHQQGGDLLWQIGTGYFGCRTDQGRFDLKKFQDKIQQNPVKAIEIKMSQGAKPGMGGLLPAAKITAEVAEIRGIPMGVDCASPSAHPEFHDVDSMLDFVERLADATGLPVGIKSAVGETTFWTDLAMLMSTTNRGVDFVSVDGGEGGTGAAPLVFADHVSLPFKLGFSRVYREFVEYDMHDKIVFNGAGKLGFPESGLFAMALGCDTISIAREAMLAIGCIQAQRCHTGHCPAGVATQNRWLQRGLDPTLKSVRVANYIITLRKEMLRLTRACGQEHPSLITLEHFDILQENLRSEPATKVFEHWADWGLPSAEDQEAIRSIMRSPVAEREALIQSHGALVQS